MRDLLISWLGSAMEKERLGDILGGYCIGEGRKDGRKDGWVGEC